MQRAKHRCDLESHDEIVVVTKKGFPHPDPMGGTTCVQLRIHIYVHLPHMEKVASDGVIPVSYLWLKSPIVTLKGPKKIPAKYRYT